MTEGTACTYEKKFSRHNREPKAPYILCGRQAATFTGHGARTTTGIDIKVGHHLYEPGPHTYFARQGTPSRITNHESRPTNHDPRITTTTNDKNRRPGQFLPPHIYFRREAAHLPDYPEIPDNPDIPDSKVASPPASFSMYNLLCQNLHIYSARRAHLHESRTTNHESRLCPMTQIVKIDDDQPPYFPFPDGRFYAIMIKI